MCIYIYRYYYILLYVCQHVAVSIVAFQPQQVPEPPHATRGHGGFLLAGWRMSCGWKHPMASMDGARCIVCLLCWWWVFDIFYYKTALLTCLAKVVSDACIGTTFWQTNLVPVFGGFGAWSRFNWICSGWMQWAVIHLGRVPNRLLALPKEKLAAPLEFWVNRKSPTVGSLTKNWCFLSAGRCPNLVNLQSACFTSYQPRKWHPVASIYIYCSTQRCPFCAATEHWKEQTPCTRIQLNDSRVKARGVISHQRKMLLLFWAWVNICLWKNIKVVNLRPAWEPQRQRHGFVSKWSMEDDKWW